MRMLGASVLTMEALVIGFAMLVAKDLSVRSEIPAGWIGAALAVAALVAAGLLRSRVGWILGSLVQVGLVLMGLVVPMMFVLGGLFAVLWAAAIVVGRMGEQARARLMAGQADTDR
jgi:O-antigen ligase